MRALRATVRKWIQSTGYDIHKVPGDPGRDPYRDIGRLVASTSPVAFDVGANTGQTTNAILQVLPRASIHAFEPHPAAFESLRRLNIKNVVLNNYALGAQPEERTLFENTSSDMSSLLPLGEHGWGHVQAKTAVKVSTVDHYCTKHGIPRIDLLKSDTQGFELEVLKGASAMLEGNLVRLIYLEMNFARLYEGMPRFDALLGFLFDRGFELVALYRVHYLGERAGWTDGLFINSRCLPDVDYIRHGFLSS
jgi:FkbM family methyltransferase